MVGLVPYCTLKASLIDKITPHTVIVVCSLCPRPLQVGVELLGIAAQNMTGQ